MTRFTHIPHPYVHAFRTQERGGGCVGSVESHTVWAQALFVPLLAATQLHRHTSNTNNYIEEKVGEAGDDVPVQAEVSITTAHAITDLLLKSRFSV